MADSSRPNDPDGLDVPEPGMSPTEQMVVAVLSVVLLSASVGSVVFDVPPKGLLRALVFGAYIALGGSPPAWLAVLLWGSLGVLLATFVWRQHTTTEGKHDGR